MPEYQLRITTPHGIYRGDPRKLPSDIYIEREVNHALRSNDGILEMEIEGNKMFFHTDFLRNHCMIKILKLT